MIILRILFLLFFTITDYSSYFTSPHPCSWSFRMLYFGIRSTFAQSGGPTSSWTDFRRYWAFGSYLSHSYRYFWFEITAGEGRWPSFWSWSYGRACLPVDYFSAWLEEIYWTLPSASNCWAGDPSCRPAVAASVLGRRNLRVDRTSYYPTWRFDLSGSIIVQCRSWLGGHSGNVCWKRSYSCHGCLCDDLVEWLSLLGEGLASSSGFGRVCFSGCWKIGKREESLPLEHGFERCLRACQCLGPQ